GRLLERADVSSLAPDDASLHLVGRELHHRHGGLRGEIRGHALDGERHDLLGLAVGLALGALLDLAERVGRLRLGRLAQVLDQLLARLLGREAGDVLEPAPHLGRAQVHLGGAGREILLTTLHLLDPLLHVRLARVQALALAVQGAWRLFGPALGTLDLLTAAGLFLLPRLAQAEAGLAAFELPGFPGLVRFVTSPVQDAGGLVLSLALLELAAGAVALSRDEEPDSRTQD